ncbi:MAG: M23 family metallopeptidase [Pseudomonadota bacterium]
MRLLKSRRGVLLSLVSLFFSMTASMSVGAEPAVTVERVLPETVYLERRGELLRLNFDLLLNNSHDEDKTLNYLDLRLYNEAGQILKRRIMDGNGLPGAITMLPNRIIPAGGELHLFSPFPDLHVRQTVSEVRLRGFYDGGSFEAMFQPVNYDGPILAHPPLEGTAYIFAGNDLFAHHRRVSLASEPARELGMQRITQRFALDFTVLDEDSGDLAVGDLTKLDNWPAYGRKIFAPLGGVVAAVRRDMPDNHMTQDAGVQKPENYESFGEDASLGNYVILQVEDAYLVMSHFKEGSLNVKLGDRVATGETLGLLGLSGDTVYPHLHMQMQDGQDILHSAPLPIIFDCAFVGVGEHYEEVRNFGADTGDFVRACSDR